eukprot:CAMPEP_0202880048 /NCGR_PEP_ID=MMETSP1391-20130828/34512_1 /ASSEMBLY_ACC=CAM_ASM_000867 /TAXON_ID=1034604 /ORGANISM="Chlamydomonas leiostraca, Strain SAG 11-49" /LENGTH=395 /DNA_ID=CAMNT_0049562493 /DNA_START=46 /DNA_END=1233 /DNA_ORIENTATION=-
MAQVPLMPYLTKELGAESSAAYGALQTVFSAFQLVGGLLSGPFVDRYGGRALLAVSFLASFASYLTTATATSMAALYASRLFTLAQHAVLAARTIVTAATGDEDRARLLGYVGVAYGVGFAAGPAIGGVLSQVSLRFAAHVAAFGSLAAWGAVVLLVPADTGKQAGQGTAGSSSSSAPAKPGLRQSLGVLRVREVRLLLGGKLLIGLAGGMLQAVFSLLLQRTYGLTSKQNGLVLSYVGVATMVCQVTLVGPAQRRLRPRTAGLGCAALMAAGYLALGVSRQLPVLMASLLPIAAGGVVLATLNTAQLTQAVPSHVAGSVLALDMALGSGVRMLTPGLATGLFEAAGSLAVGCVAAGLMLLLILADVVGLASPALDGVGAGRQATGEGDETKKSQ